MPLGTAVKPKGRYALPPRNSPADSSVTETVNISATDQEATLCEDGPLGGVLILAKDRYLYELHNACEFFDALHDQPRNEASDTPANRLPHFK
jgi:hypothetical protein